jgi:hypothetical protein
VNREYRQTFSPCRLVALLGAGLGVALLGGCAANPKSALAPIANRQSAIANFSDESARAATAARESAAAAVAPQPEPTPVEPLTLIWNVNDRNPDTVTQIYSSPDATRPVSEWELLAEERNGAIYIWPTNVSQYFIARNRLFNEVSDWDRKP